MHVLGVIICDGVCDLDCGYMDFGYEVGYEVGVALSVSRVCAESWWDLPSLWADLVLARADLRHVCAQSGWGGSPFEDGIFITTTPPPSRRDRRSRNADMPW